MIGEDVTWANAALRSSTIARLAAMGGAALPLVDRVLEPAIGREGFDSKTAVVTAIGILEALASGDATERLEKLARGPRPLEVAHASAALRRLGQTVPSRGTPAGPPRDVLVGQIADGTPKERELALACALGHADLELLPLIRSALQDSAAGVREEAARTCGRLGDAACFDLLLERLRTRPPAPASKARRGPLPAGVRDALGAWNGLAELGDLRACEEVERFEGDAAYARLRFEHGDQATEVFERLCRSRRGR
jgi:hypothetical protein